MENTPTIFLCLVFVAEEEYFIFVNWMGNLKLDSSSNVSFYVDEFIVSKNGKKQCIISNPNTVSSQYYIHSTEIYLCRVFQGWEFIYKLSSSENDYKNERKILFEIIVYNICN